MRGCWRKCRKTLDTLKTLKTMPSTLSKFAAEGTQTHYELQVEAAVIIQRFYNSRRTSMGSSTSLSEPGENYEGCSEPFGMQTDEGMACDRCDVSGSFQHSHCLQSSGSDQNEYNLCLNCLSRRTLVDSKLSGDTSHDGSAVAVLASASQAVEHARQDEQAAYALLQVIPYDKLTVAIAKLKSDLDYMLKYLELGKCSIAQELNNQILLLVKDTLEWMKNARTVGQIRARTEEVSDTMTGLL